MRAWVLGLCICAVVSLPTTPDNSNASPQQWEYCTSGNAPSCLWSSNFPSCASDAQSPVALGCDVLVSRSGITLETGDCLITKPTSNEASPSTGHAWEFVYDESACSNLHRKPSHIAFLNHVFTLESFQFHHPAEHLVNGKRYDAEAHLIHRNEQGNLLVLAIPLEQDTTSSLFFETLINSFSAPISALNPYVNLLPSNTTLFHYRGSLTSPPCSPADVLVLANPSKISQAHLERLKAAIQQLPQTKGGNENARPLQLLNDRNVTLYVDVNKFDDFQSKETETPAPVPAVPVLVPFRFATDSGGGYGGAPLPLDDPVFQNPLTNPWLTLQVGQYPYFL